MTLARLSMCAERINSKYSNYTLLDAGCRTMALKPLLRACRKYHGTDLIPSDGVLQCDLETRLPFEDDAFDIVTVLDVLEHLNDPHGALRELLRVARKAVYVSLPNMYYVQFRLNFLLKGHLSGKYAFPPEPIVDRHRWVLSYQEAVSFVSTVAQGHIIAHDMILPVRGRSKLLMEPLEKWLGCTWPNLFCYGVLSEIQIDKPQGETATI